MQNISKIAQGVLTVKTVQKDSEGGAVVKDRKDSGEQGGRPVRILTMDEIRK